MRMIKLKRGDLEGREVTERDRNGDLLGMWVKRHYIYLNRKNGKED